jgi:hypothetical protein
MTTSPYPDLDEVATPLFKESIPRPAGAGPQFRGGTAVRLDGPAERAAAAVGALLAWKLIQHGGCLLPVGPARRAADRLMASFPEIDRRRLEREVAEVLRWLEDALSLLDDDWQEADERGVYPWEDREFPDDGKTETIRRAIDDGADLEIDYFTYSRNAITHRRITPLDLHGGRKLRALCHWRRDERHFLLRRIKEVRPVVDPTRRVGS